MLGSPSLTSRAAPLRMRPRTVVAADPRLPRAVPDGTEAVVVGGGIAGVSAAVVLAERGVAVTLLEAAPTLGGRLGAWPHTLPDGTDQVVEHGFHAFFRHYYTWRDVLRRIDPELGFLRPVGGYPVLSRTWAPEDLTGLPAAPPLNLLALFARSPSLGLRDLLGSDTGLASELLAYDRDADHRPVRRHAGRGVPRRRWACRTGRRRCCSRRSPARSSRSRGRCRPAS